MLRYKKRWTQKEKDFINHNYKNMAYKSIAKTLGRSYIAIISQAFKLGLISGRKGFKKGNVAFKGKTHTLETKKRLSENMNGRQSWNKGKICPWTTKRNLENNPSKNPRISKKISKIKKQQYLTGQLSDCIGAKGKKNPNYVHGKGYEPYGKEFNKKLREFIRKRDNYRCQQCFREQSELFRKTKAGVRPCKLDVHHIDFNKKNNNPNNLISLCRVCHAQTQFNRDNWINYFQNKIGGNL